MVETLLGATSRMLPGRRWYSQISLKQCLSVNTVSASSGMRSLRLAFEAVSQLDEERGASCIPCRQPVLFHELLQDFRLPIVKPGLRAIRAH